MGHEYPVLEQLGESAGDSGKVRGMHKFCGIDVVQGLQAEVAFNMNQGLGLVLYRAVRSDLDDAYLYRAITSSRTETGGLEIHDGESTASAHATIMAQRMFKFMDSPSINTVQRCPYLMFLQDTGAGKLRGRRQSPTVERDTANTVERSQCLSWYSSFS